ncbi:hypothetical protein TcCL_NonESM03104 [Trypanosoma cruzi]|nr:hypothetical protein TcCL_NonESM03104 [Trypanosoma cruzi]
MAGGRLSGGLLSALGGSGLCAPCLTVSVGRQSAVEKRSEGLRRLLVCARPSLCRRVCAVRMALSCGATPMALLFAALVVQRASPLHDTVLVCGTVKGVEICEGVRVAVVSVHLDLQTRGTTRPPLAAPRPWIERM